MSQPPPTGAYNTGYPPQPMNPQQQQYPGYQQPPVAQPYGQPMPQNVVGVVPTSPQQQPQPQMYQTQPQSHLQPQSPMAPQPYNTQQVAGNVPAPITQPYVPQQQQQGTPQTQVYQQLPPQQQQMYQQQPPMGVVAQPYGQPPAVVGQPYMNNQQQPYGQQVAPQPQMYQQVPPIQGQVQGQGLGQQQPPFGQPYQQQPYQQAQPGYPPQQQMQYQQQQQYQTGQPGQPQQQQPYGQQQYQPQMPNMQGLSLGPNPGPNPVVQAPAPQGENRINQAQVPNPATVLEANKAYVFNTNATDMPPPSSIQQAVIDQHNSAPYFMRSTLYTIPDTEDTLNNTSLPFAIHTTPLAGHDTLPLVDHGPSGPIRCTRCMAYMNPHNTFINGGKFFICKLCDYENDVPQHYFSATLPSGVRSDYDQRAELQRGSYEFVALTKPTDPKLQPAYVFAIEISTNTVTSGVLATVVQSLRKVLNEMYDHTPQRIGIITYDTDVHFWSFKKNYNTPQMKVVTKSSVFVPIQEGFLVDYRESKALVDYFFDNITNFFKYPQPPNKEFAFGAAVQSASLALEKCGGRVFAFSTNLPKGNPGAVHKRDAKSEKNLVPAPAPFSNFYKPVAQHCAKTNVSVNLFLIPSEECELATTAVLATTTGGHIHYYQHLRHDSMEALHDDIVHDATQPYGLNVAIKIRCSRGLTVASNLGHFVEEEGEVRIAGLTNDKCITTLIKYDDKLKPKSKAYLQFAMMYTNMRGESRIRVHNLRLNVEAAAPATMSTFFKDADLDSIITLFARVRTITTEKAVDLLASYRKHCAADKSHTQLILPECFKLLPIYVLAMMKAPAFLLSGSTPDLRVYLVSLFASLPPAKIIPMVYPRLYPIHNLQPQHGTQHADHHYTILPPFVRLSQEQVVQDGVFIVENGRNIFIWVQQFASQNVLRDLFSIDSIVGHNATKIASLFASLNGANDYHQRVENIVSEISRLRGLGSSQRSVQFVIQNDPMDSYLRSLFYEDKGLDSVSYIDYLCQIHRQIQNKLS
ncbi:hypothetical protein SAMD00019534_059060 [Acytostelium subglobosum LB1]|uniref:hypothetical protein n=1 Tax=Acytostelium subglobosum LB1 TaxID=1410327 RepID=UPI000644C354|nr:hypothetical protein SAMD00019534_059060 [Acytostelium subglobosum LB1]GAM22731.1 hypothetical protein SAMD00019534_059060 [Acytostelium subglobosum LB1]|eukprot:XP_012753958.1 hypothetical protein SAMD00019534_059060 [Acytostelium subglobosum LB1]